MSLRVLIVEDEQIVAADIETKLVRMGHRVVGIAASGREAISLAEEGKPEIVLMDIQLQGEMKGTEAARRIRERTGAQIIFITAFSGVFLRDPQQMQPPGICLSKPFSEGQLKTTLDVVAKSLRTQ